MSGSDAQATFIEAAAADTDGVCVAQSVSSATDLTINGALASGGAVTFDQPRNVTILSAGNDSGITFTVTGTDETASAVTETITGANTGTATGTTYFATISQIASSGAAAGNVSVGSGTSIAAPIFRGSMRLIGLYVVNTGTAGTVTFRQTSATGTVRMQFNTVASANTNAYPDIPDEGIRFNAGGYVVYTQTVMSSMTAFHA
jgi:VCBS repeat-containing protein